MPDLNKLKEYDEEPVTYCAKCYSLKIKYEEAIGSDCCMDCGCSDTVTSSIEEWERLYEKRYGHKFTEKSNDLRKSLVFQMPLKELEDRVCDCPSWKKIIKEFYPSFPQGLSKADSIILFFDKVIKENRLDESRYLLIKYINGNNYGRGEVM